MPFPLPDIGGVMEGLARAGEAASKAIIGLVVIVGVLAIALCGTLGYFLSR
jgi:hypothetical protein